MIIKGAGIHLHVDQQKSGKRARNVYVLSVKINISSCSSGLTKRTILFILHKEINHCPWIPHYVQELSLQNGIRRINVGLA